MFYKLPWKNNQSIVVFLSGVDFLGYRLQLQQGLVISGSTHARDMPLRNCVPVFHLLPCLNPLISMVFFCQRRTWILCFLSSPPSCTTSTSVSFSALTNTHLTPYPSLQACISTASFLVLFLSISPEVLEQVLKVEQVTTNQPFGEGCQCRNAALGPSNARFGSICVLWSDKLLESELSLSGETSHFLIK